jgi:hypothetical protein
VLLLVALLNSVFFFHGCESKAYHFTAGIAVPYVELAYYDDHWFPSELIDSRPWAVALNFFLPVLILVVIDRRWPRVAGCFATRRLLALLLISWAIFNSFSIWHALWMNAVWAPTGLIFDGVRYVCGEFEPVTGRRVVGLISRCYLLLVLLVSFTSISVIRYVHRNYVAITPERWWQFHLAGLLALMLILGSGVGLLIRWMMSP